jgi:hypothetical protein
MDTITSEHYSTVKLSILRAISTFLLANPSSGFEKTTSKENACPWFGSVPAKRKKHLLSIF